jgi:trimeric autotransporter adhesin
VGGNQSQIQMPSSTVINIDAVQVYAVAYNSTEQYSSYLPGSTVFIRALVSDPFGNADINSSTISITDPTSTVQVNNAAMTAVANPDGASTLYEYQYISPASPEGFWTLDITANEGTEGTISHNSQSTMILGTSNINVSKTSQVLSDPINASNPKAIPGAIVEYTITVSNSGYGYADLDSIMIDDPLAAQTSFYFGNPLNPAQFTDGATPSGLSYTFTSLGSGTDDIDFSNDGGSSFVTPSVDASGYDTTTPAINFIRINPKGELRGSDGVNNPSFTINYKLKIN